MGDLKKAMSLLAPLTNLDPEAKSRLADVCSRAGDTARALALYREAYAAGLQTPLVLVNLGTLEAQAGNLARARELWTAALKHNPGLSEAADNLGKIGGHTQPEAKTARKLALGQLP
jgi:Flp pilus assembly protein TadD